MSSTEYTSNPKAWNKFLGGLAQMVGPNFVEASDHSGSCRCSLCLRWWATVGPDDDGKHGPFTKAEISVASHPAICKCVKCLQWYAMMGPNEDGKYDPFTEAEVVEATIAFMQEVGEDEAQEPTK